MPIKVTLSDGTVITPSYSPEHIKGVTEYYNEQVRLGLIKSWKITP